MSRLTVLQFVNRLKHMNDSQFYTELSMEDLFYEILDLEKGDGWDGMMSKHHAAELHLAKTIFLERLEKLTCTNT